MKGRVVKIWNQWVTVMVPEGPVLARPRGKLSSARVLVGDEVEVELLPDGRGIIRRIEARRNQLERPPVANVDRLLVVFSWESPKVAPEWVDRVLLQGEWRRLAMALFLNKGDLLVGERREEGERFLSLYRQAGYPAWMGSAREKENLEPVEGFLAGEGITVLAGESGLGKTRLLNALYPGLELKSGVVSEKTGRGRHTTRHPQLLPTGKGWVVDTPGFSRLFLPPVEPHELGRLFPEMRERAQECRFRDCLHRTEPGCAVREAVHRGEVDESRFGRYLQFLEELLAERKKTF
ncbi:MAG: ribosome small subunit-dependent GTPase A [Bacillota bacterium]|nr:ribosome small subunit-dependent GTPase A [Bacillota bacterium]